jgi:uncharacterized protein (TIGR02186 family)
MKIGCSVFFAVFCLFLVSGAAAQDSVRINVEPSTIDIGTFYNGATISATGSIPANSEAVVRFMGAACDLHMKRRGKVAGVMWMNLDSITFSGAPSVCLISSAVDLNQVEFAANASIAPLKLSGLKESIRIESNGNKENAFDEFLKLKRQEGLYREMLGNISYKEASDGERQFAASIPVPSRLGPGDYTVELSVIRNGQVIAQSAQPVKVNLVGFPELLAQLAFGRPALYGILATVIALLAGLGIGLVFQSKGSH